MRRILLLSGALLLAVICLTQPQPGYRAEITAVLLLCVSGPVIRG